MGMLTRQKFQAGNLLTSADLNAAQLYQIDLGRKHRAGAHLPGVVDGLQIEKIDTELILRAGYAVDEFGRDLVLRLNEVLDPKLADAQRDQPGADTFEILLHYNKQPVRIGNKIDPTRLDETPRVEVRALLGKPDDPIPFKVVQSAPDDPAYQRPVQLGVLKSAPDAPGEWLLLLDAGHRQETGVVAATIAPAHDDKSSITLANGEFAVVLPSAIPVAGPQTAAGKAPNQGPGEESKRLSVTASGAVFRGSLTVEGDVEAGHQLLLPKPGPAPAGAGCGLYLIGDANNAPDMHELRLVLPANGALAIGALNPQSGKFEAVLTVNAATRSVNVAGDLIIEGAVVDRLGPNQPTTEAGAAPPTVEGTTMFANILTTLRNLSISSGKTTLGILPMILLTWLGIYWDGSAGALPCQTVNPIRRILGIDPLLCHGITTNTPSVTTYSDARIAGDSTCVRSADGKTLLTNEQGELQGNPAKGSDIETFNNAVMMFEPAYKALQTTKIAGPDSIWIYCKKKKE